MYRVNTAVIFKYGVNSIIILERGDLGRCKGKEKQQRKKRVGEKDEAEDRKNKGGRMRQVCKAIIKPCI